MNETGNVALRGLVEGEGVWLVSPAARPDGFSPNVASSRAGRSRWGITPQEAPAVREARRTGLM